MPRLRRLAPSCLLLVALLACQTITGPASTSVPITTARATSLPRATPRPASTPTPGPSPTPQSTLSASFEDLDQFQAAMRPEFAADVEQFPKATRYAIEVMVSLNDDDSATLLGRERVRYTNQQAAALEDMYLMLWPNEGHQYFSQMSLRHVTIAGAEVQPEIEQGGIAAHLRLPAPLEPGASLDLGAEFEVEAYTGIEASGAARFGLTRGVLLAPTFYPLIPRIVDGEWQTMPAPPGGDTTNSDTAFYTWQVSAPVEDPRSETRGAPIAIVATGSVVKSERSGARQTQTLVTGPMRDLALVVGPLTLRQRQADGITFNAYLLEQDAEFADQMLDLAEGQVRTLQELVGPYPFAELDLVDAPGAFGGIEYPGTVFIGAVSDSDFFEVATVHEVGHQWFYSLIGDDQLLQPWLDEAAATYTEVLYFEKVRGAPVAQRMLDGFRRSLKYAANPDLPIGLPVGAYPSENDYGAIVYLKGALFFDALRRELGDETFFAFLKNYYAAYRYGFATSADFQATAEQTCACDLDGLFDLWVYDGGPVTPR